MIRVWEDFIKTIQRSVFSVVANLIHYVCIVLFSVYSMSTRAAWSKMPISIFSTHPTVFNELRSIWNMVAWAIPTFRSQTIARIGMKFRIYARIIPETCESGWRPHFRRQTNLLSLPLTSIFPQMDINDIAGNPFVDS